MTTSASKGELKLLPCPFCGGEAFIFQGIHKRWNVCCQECVAGIDKKEECEVINNWNTRTPPRGEEKQDE